MLEFSNFFSFGLSGKIQMIFVVLKVILFEHSKYSNTLQNVWYSIFLGNDFHNSVFV